MQEINVGRTRRARCDLPPARQVSGALLHVQNVGNVRPPHVSRPPCPGELQQRRFVVVCSGAAGSARSPGRSMSPPETLRTQSVPLRPGNQMPRHRTLPVNHRAEDIEEERLHARKWGRCRHRAAAQWGWVAERERTKTCRDERTRSRGEDVEGGDLPQFFESRPVGNPGALAPAPTKLLLFTLRSE